MTLDAAVALTTEFKDWQAMLYSCDKLGFVPRLVPGPSATPQHRRALQRVRGALRAQHLPYSDGRGYVDFSGLSRQWAECGPRAWDCEGKNPMQASAAGEITI